MRKMSHHSNTNHLSRAVESLVIKHPWALHLGVPPRQSLAAHPAHFLGGVVNHLLICSLFVQFALDKPSGAYFLLKKKEYLFGS